MSSVRAAIGLLILLAFAAPSARADTALVGVASNFADAATEIAQRFAADTRHQVEVSLGATGKFYAQIRAGAPYDAFLAADRERPAMLETEGHAVAGSRFTYAVGRLTLWSADPQRIGADPQAVLADPAIRAVAIANPALAPYGRAAAEALQNLGLDQRLRLRLVTAENVGQAFALVATGNAEIGFVATSLLEGRRGKALGGSRWDVPAHLHAPIRQDGVLLKRAAANPAARAFLDFLRGAKARAIMARLGYKIATE